jgi:hypothetical protein
MCATPRTHLSAAPRCGGYTAALKKKENERKEKKRM